jgi:RimJ/RimL family protein N-acetyltransferase
MDDLNPRLLGERVVLHPLGPEHADALFPILSDPQLWHYAPRPRSRTANEFRERFARLESRRSDDGLEHWLNWAVEKRDSGETIGFVQATVEATRASASVAYIVGRAWWGHGLASDAVAAMLAHLERIGVREVSATVDSRNERSIRLIVRLGFCAEDAHDPRNVVYRLPFDFARGEDGPSTSLGVT